MAGGLHPRYGLRTIVGATMPSVALNRAQFRRSRASFRLRARPMARRLDDRASVIWGGKTSELRVTKLLRVSGLVDCGTAFARGEGDFPPGGLGYRSTTLMASFGLFLGISLMFQGLMTGRDTGLETAIKMRLLWGSRVPYSSI